MDMKKQKTGGIARRLFHQFVVFRMFFKPFYGIGTCGHSLLALGLDLVHGSFHQFAGHALASEGLVHKCMVDIYGILIYVRECDFSNGPHAVLV